MTNSELCLFKQKFGKSYFAHLRRNPTSLLARIYGVFTVKISDMCDVHLMLMGHTLQIDNPNLIDRVFDIKGSRVKREVSLNKNTSRHKTLKDINFLFL